MTGSIRVVNLFKEPEARKTGIYVGRYSHEYGFNASPLGNPFHVTLGEREEPLRQYRIWLWERIKDKKSPAWLELVRIAEKVKAGEEVLLACYCAPKGCHGDVVKAAIEWMIRAGKV